MNGMDYLVIPRKLIHSYETVCNPFIKKYRLNQSDFDVIMFLANNPEYNTAKDICQIRDIKSGIVSVTVERLCQTGLLIRQADSSDRRIQRLILTPKSDDIVDNGRHIQKQFMDALIEGITPDEFRIYDEVTRKLTDNAAKIERR